MRRQRGLPPGAGLILAPLILQAAACSEGEGTAPDGAAGTPSIRSLPSEPTPPETTSTEPCNSTFEPTDPTALIDDMEDRDGFISPTGGRNGSWWLGTDMTAGTIVPPPNMMLVTEPILGGRCGSRQAIRVTGQGFTDWGAAIVLNFKYTTETAAPIDVSAFRGVRLWARVGEAHSSPVRVQIDDANTSIWGGVCNPAADVPDQCWDGFGTGLVPLDTEWRLYELEFSRMIQSGFGYKAEALDTARLYRMTWTLAQESVFDLWIDDVSFY